MQIEVIYRDGVFVPTVPLHVKRERLSIFISEDEAEILDTKQKGKETSTKTPLRQQLDHILGPYARSRARLASMEDKAHWHKHLEEKHLL